MWARVCSANEHCHLGEAEHGEFVLIPCHLQDTGTALEVEKCSLRYGDVRTGSRVPRPAVSLGPSGSQALGHPGPPGSCKRAENGVGACGVDLAWGRGGKRESSG